MWGMPIMPMNCGNAGYAPMLNCGMTCCPNSVMANFPSLDRIAYNRFSGQAPATTQALTATQTKLQELLSSDLLTAEQKSQIQAKINEIGILVRAIQTLVSNANVRAEMIYALEDEIARMQTSVQALAQSLSAAANQPAQGSQQGGQNQVTPETPETPEDQLVIDEQLEAELKEIENKSVDICEKVYQGAIGVTGTDYDKIKEGTNQINKDNVAFVLKNWETQYPNKGSLIKVLFDEEWGWNCRLHKGQMGADGKVANPDGNVDIIWNIVKSLEEKAKELGIYNQLAGQFTVAYDELDDTFVCEPDVINAVNIIADKVSAAQQINMVEKARERQQAPAQGSQNNEAQQTNNDNVLEARRVFQDDMRRAFDDENAKISDRVRYENGQFIIRIEGKNYTGATFEELAEQVKDAGYDPKQYLTKQQLRAAA